MHVDLAGADREFLAALAERPEAAAAAACFTCRTCTASCPVTSVDCGFDPVRIIRMAAYGLKEAVLKSTEIWLCAGCYTCQERCPQKVPITDFMTVLKNMACAAGYLLPQGVRIQRDTVLKDGRMYPIDDFDNKKRLKAALPELPVSCRTAALLFPDHAGTGPAKAE